MVVPQFRKLAILLTMSAALLDTLNRLPKFIFNPSNLPNLAQIGFPFPPQLSFWGACVCLKSKTWNGTEVNIFEEL